MRRLSVHDWREHMHTIGDVVPVKDVEEAANKMREVEHLMAKMLSDNAVGEHQFEFAVLFGEIRAFNKHGVDIPPAKPAFRIP